MNVEDIKNKLDLLRQDYKNVAHQMFSEGTKILFDAHPRLQSFGFRAYSPYFNDGDECRFSIHADEDYGLKINGFSADGDEDERDDDEDDENFEADVRVFENIWPKRGKYDYSSGYRNAPWVDGEPDVDALVKDVSDFISAFDDETWEELIGNHVEVTIDRVGGLTTVDYSDHD